jgi:hypothetical protein
MKPAQRLALAALALAGLCPVLGVQARYEAHKSGEVMVTPVDLEWRNGPPSLPAGAKVALLEGDPARKGPFVMRAKLPDGYKIAAHTHPRDERVTVISGTLYVGMGAKLDTGKGKALPAGSYARMPAGMKHYAWAKGETVIQVNGEGPWVIQYVDPNDDPRKKK